MSKDTFSGTHDPYYFENLVGAGYLLDMLADESGIAGVGLQFPRYEGADDVVVRHTNGSVDLVQVKHTVDQSETFSHADLIAQPKAQDGKLSYSILQKLIRACYEATEEGLVARPSIVTNRKGVTKPSTVKSRTDSKYITLPPLDKFVKLVRDAASGAKDFNDIALPPEYTDAWELWKAQIAALGESKHTVEHLRTLKITTDFLNLSALEESVLARLAGMLRGSAPLAQRVFSRLANKLEHWATKSLRTAEFVDQELLRNALDVEEANGHWHELPPPSPFFGSREAFCKSLEAQLRGRSAPYCFLESLPGGGKTSIISYLANRRDSVVDLRYHAFIPIQPGQTALPPDSGRATSATSLWNDLFVQLKALLKKHGLLGEFRVPISAGVLDYSELRTEVLRLADALGNKLGRTIVIAIDGLDHAARAKQPLVPNLLESLPAPTSVPDRVCILLAGQPAKANPEYPHWLRSSSGFVIPHEVPPIQVEDILDLLDSVIPPARRSENDTAARIIASHAKGSTLAAVYAVHELAGTEITDFEGHLKSRKLAPELGEYYDTIWEQCRQGCSEEAKTAISIIEVCLWLSAFPIQSEFMLAAFPDVRVSSLTWLNLLRQLSPLVIEEDEGFRIRHNDVRIYLHGKVASDSALVAHTASALIDGMQSNVKYYPALVSRGPELFMHIPQPGEVADLIRPDFVRTAWIEGANQRELMTFVTFACSKAAVPTSIESLHTFTRGLDTWAQLDSCLQQLGTVPTRIGSEGEVTIQAERRVDPVIEWTVTKLVSVLREAEAMRTGGDFDRADAMVHRWFEGLSAVEILEAVVPLQQTDTRRSDKNNHRDDLRELARLLGQGHAYYGIPLGNPDKIPECDQESLSDEVDTHPLRADVGLGLLDYACACNSQRLACRATKVAWQLGLFVDEAVGVFRETLESGEWRRAVGVAVWSPIDTTKTSSLNLLVSALRAVVRTVPTTSVEELEALTRSGGDSLGRNEWLSSVWAYLRAVSRPSESVGEIASLTLGVEGARPSDERELVVYADIMRKAAHLGKWVAAMGSANRGGNDVLPDLEAVLKYMQSLLKPTFGWAPFGRWTYYQWVRTAVSAALQIADTLGQRVQDAVTDLLLTHFPWDGFVMYADAITKWIGQGHVKSKFEALITSELAPGGVIANADTSERVEMAMKVQELARRLKWEVGEHAISRRVRELSLGYVGRKDYSLGTAAFLSAKVFEDDPLQWETSGVRLMELSEKASDIGENRSYTYIEEAIASGAVRGGATSTWRLSESRDQPEYPLRVGTHAFFEGLISNDVLPLLEEDALLALLVMVVGLCDWRVSSERDVIVRFIGHASERAKTGGMTVVERMLLAEFKYYVDLASSERFAERKREAGPEMSPESVDVEAIPMASDSAFARWAENLEGKLSTLGLYEANDALRKALSSYRTVVDTLEAGRLHSTSVTLMGIVARFSAYQVSHGGFSDLARRSLAQMTVAECLEWAVLRFNVLGSRNEEEGFRGGNARACLGDALLVLKSLWPRASEDDRRIALEAELAMHELWQSSSHTATPASQLPDVQEVTGWLEVAALVLLTQVKSASTYRSHRALRGLAALVSIAEGRRALFERAAERGDLTRKLVLSLVEFMARQGPLDSVTEKFAMDGLSDADPKLRLTAWVALGKWQNPPQVLKKPDSLPPKDASHNGTTEIAIQTEPKRVGGTGLLNSSQAMKRKLGFLEEVVDIDLGNVSASFNSGPPESAEALVPYPDRSMAEVVRSVPEGDFALFRALEGAASIDDFDETTVVRVAQAVLTNDDPQLFMTDPKLWAGRVSLPIDRELEDLVKNGKFEQLAAGLVKQLAATGQVVLGGRLVSYAYSMTVEYWVQGWLCPANTLMPRFHQVTCLCGRSAYFGRRDRYDPVVPVPQRPEVPLVLFAGGIGEFPVQSMVVTPSIAWNETMGWTPSASNPLVWMAGGKEVAWFHRTAEPTRSAIREWVHRQPEITAWVASKDAVNGVAERYGCRLAYTSGVEVDRSEMPD